MLVIFTTLILKILPLYAMMLAGYVLGRQQDGLGHATSYLQINLIAPIVMATSIGALKMRHDDLILPVVFFMLCCAIAGFTFALGKKFWPHDETANLLGYASGSANTGYFGIPVALVLFPPEVIGLFMLAALGFQLFENTLGFYLIARGHYSIKMSLKRLTRLPTLYGCLAGILLSAWHVQLPDIITNAAHDFRSAYIVLGSLMIGFGLSKARPFKIDGPFVSLLLAVKFVLWPLAVFILIVLDQQIWHLFADQTHHLIFLLAVVPLPANAVAFALLLEIQPQKAATAVFISTLVALLYIPAIYILLGFAS